MIYTLVIRCCHRQTYRIISPWICAQTRNSFVDLNVKMFALVFMIFLLLTKTKTKMELLTTAETNWICIFLANWNRMKMCSIAIVFFPFHIECVQRVYKYKYRVVVYLNRVMNDMSIAKQLPAFFCSLALVGLNSKPIKYTNRKY